MRALVFDDISRQRKCYARRGRGEAFDTVSLAGICNTDIEVTRVNLRIRIMGHEFVCQEVEADNPTLVGKALSEINIVCGECECAQRNPRRLRHMVKCMRL